MSKDKVLFNLKNAHYAKHKVTGEDGTITFDTPVAIPGSVSLSLDAEGEVTKFYADGIVYYVCQSNNGYSGDFEVAMFPEQMMLDIWGMTKSKNGLIVENANVQPASFALLFEVDGDTTGRKYVLYNSRCRRMGFYKGLYLYQRRYFECQEPAALSFNAVVHVQHRRSLAADGQQPMRTRHAAKAGRNRC